MPYFVAPTLLPIDGKPDQSKEPNQDEGEIKRYLVTWNEKGGPDMLRSHHSLSHGDRRVIYLFFSLYNAEEGSFLAVEEIENGMHIGRIERLLDEFTTQASNRNIQTLLTTHNLEILNKIRPSEAIYCKKDSSHGTTFIHCHESGDFGPIKADLGREPTTREMIELGLMD